MRRMLAVVALGLTVLLGAFLAPSWLAGADADPGEQVRAGTSDPNPQPAVDQPTTTTVAPERRAIFDCREVGGQRVCDTFGESDEGPGTDDDSDERPDTTERPQPSSDGESQPAPDGAVYDCRPMYGREVCDTFGESDEGPGTYDDSDEGPGTR